MKRIIFIHLALLLTLGTASAQRYTGILANVDAMTIGDMASLTQTQFQYGTARSMSMAGALSSLGADPSVMSTNPAGIGMYQGSEFSVTPLVTVQKSKSNADTYGGNLTRVSLGNLSFVMSMPFNNSGRGLLSLNFGVGYNRLTDLNYATSMYSSTSGRESSIGQFFSGQLNDNGVTLSQVESGVKNSKADDYLSYSNITPNIWGAVGGYRVGLCDWGGGAWSPAWIGDGASVGHYLNINSRGSMGEYNISGAANISNKLYIGMTLGITRLKQQVDYNYSEDYRYADGAATSDYAMNFAHYNQTAIVEGAGVNFKLGVIYRPVKAVRLSFAVHTPTAYSINRQYQVASASSVKVHTSTPEAGINPDNEGDAHFDFMTPILEDFNDDGWYFNTPTRILVGGSFMLGNRALLSADYQRDWYGGMKMTSTPYGVGADSYNMQISQYFESVNTLRFGGEFRVTPNFSLRGGYGFSTSLVNETFQAENPSSPMVDNTMYYSAGFGYVVNKVFTIDFAYMRHTTHYTDFVLYGVEGADVYSLDYVRHNIALTTSFKF